MKGKHKAGGGKIDNDMAGEEKETKEKGDKGFKRGGKAAHKKHGGKVEGKKAHQHAGKMARGGGVKGMSSKVESAAGMSATSPLSGAGKTAEPKAPKMDKEDD